MLRALISSVVAVGLAVAGVSATVVVPTSFREVVRDAGLIVRGQITDVRGEVVPAAGVESVATIAVAETLKGPPDPFVSIRVPGGSVGRERFVMVGAPRLDVGEQAVFFLKRGSDNTWRPVGLTLGLYRVQAEPLTGRPVVDPPLVARATASVGPVVRGDARRRLMPVQTFESLVRLVMAGQAVPASRGRR